MNMKNILIFLVCLSLSVFASSTPTNDENGNYILMLNKNACIKHFVPQFLENITSLLDQSHIIENTKIVKRDTNEEQVHVFDAYDIGTSFKAIGVRLNKDVLHVLNQYKDIVEVIPDYTVKFNLPTTTFHENKHYIKKNEPSSFAARNNLFQLDQWEHDVNCPSYKSNNDRKQLEIIQNESSVTTTVPKNTTYDEQEQAEWNLVRISEQNRDLERPYIYDSEAGSDVNVYVLDDGMNIGHEEFGGRASWGWSVFSNIPQLGEGHGTHVAGIIGSATYGVAKKTNLIAVQVLDEKNQGAYSSIIAGLQWIQKHSEKEKSRRAIINMSLSGPKEGAPDSTIEALQRAITAVVKEANIPVIVAAGNDANEACNMMPGGLKDVFTVGASSITDEFAGFSGYGKCVKIIAPGVSIKSTFIGSNSMTKVLSGTSMASPHVAGAAALILGSNSLLNSHELYTKLIEVSSRNKVRSVKEDTPNLLLFNGQAKKLNKSEAYNKLMLI